MVDREEQLLATMIAATLEQANEAERKYVKIIETSRVEHLDDPLNEELKDATEILARHVRRAFEECQMLAERLQMPELAKGIRKKLRLYGTGSAELISIEHNSGAGEQYCSSLAEAWTIYEPMAIVALSGAVTGLSVLETILRNTAKIIAKSGIPAENETQIRNEVLRVLQLAFLDARKDPAIAKNFKTYKPDIGIPSLMAAVEYKFLRTKKDMKSHLDQVFADIKGYDRHGIWKNFYAVFCQKGPFFTQEDVVQTFREVGAKVNWTPILTGPAA